MCVPAWLLRKLRKQAGSIFGGRPSALQANSTDHWRPTKEQGLASRETFESGTGNLSDLQGSCHGRSFNEYERHVVLTWAPLGGMSIFVFGQPQQGCQPRVNPLRTDWKFLTACCRQSSSKLPNCRKNCWPSGRPRLYVS